MIAQLWHVVRKIFVKSQTAKKELFLDAPIVDRGGFYASFP